MDRLVYQDGSDFQAGTVNLDLEFTATTAGAVPTSLTRSDGIASVVKSTNDYVVTFQDSYIALLGGYGTVIQASFATTGAARVQYSAQAVTSATAPSVTLSLYRGSDGAAVALASGDILRFTFRLTRWNTY